MASQAHTHDHGLSSIKHEKPLWWALGLTATFLIAEIIGAYLTNSLALLSDAAHMATDTLALVIALVAVRLSRLPSDAKRTYGYARFEAFGALINGSLLFMVATYILWEAVARFAKPPEVATTGMLGSLAVLIAAVIIHFTQWWILDPILAVLIGLWVLPRTWTLLRASIHILLEGVPDNIVLSDVRELLLKTEGVVDVHDLHIWSLASKSPTMTAHIVAADESVNLQNLRQTIAGQLKESFDIHHLTLQMETTNCGTKACDVAVQSEHSHEGHAHQ